MIVHLRLGPILGIQMKKLVLAMCIFATSTVGAAAADLAARPVKAPVMMPEPIISWSGFYIGGQAGGAWLDGRMDFTNDVGILDPLRFDSASSFIGGGHAGLQGQWASWVLGIEGTYNWADLHQTVPSIFPGAPRTRSLSVDGIATVVGKVGYTGGPWLIYVKGGWAGLDVDVSSIHPVTLISSTGGGWHSGWTVGGGVDYQFSRNWVAGVDLNYYTASFNGPQTFSNGVIGSVTNSRADIYAVTGRLSYLFNWGAPGVRGY